MEEVGDELEEEVEVEVEVDIAPQSLSVHFFSFKEPRGHLRPSFPVIARVIFVPPLPCCQCGRRCEVC